MTCARDKSILIACNCVATISSLAVIWLSIRYQGPTADGQNLLTELNEQATCVLCELPSHRSYLSGCESCGDTFQRNTFAKSDCLLTGDKEDLIRDKIKAEISKDSYFHQVQDTALERTKNFRNRSLDEERVLSPSVHSPSALWIVRGDPTPTDWPFDVAPVKAWRWETKQGHVFYSDGIGHGTDSCMSFKEPGWYFVSFNVAFSCSGEGSSRFKVKLYTTDDKGRPTSLMSREITTKPLQQSVVQYHQCVALDASLLIEINENECLYLGVDMPEESRILTRDNRSFLNAFFARPKRPNRIN